MDFASFFRFRTFLSKKNTKTENPDPNQEQEQLLGVTEQLIDFIKSFTLDTFKNFPLKEEEKGACSSSFGDDYDDDSPSSSANTRNDLSHWQERHAVAVLAKVKEISQLRYKLCPRHFTDGQFWRIYFFLVKSYVFEYELNAIRLAKLKRMATENEKSLFKSGYEVEMAETKQATGSSSPFPKK